jgi:putative ABC transport system ATP-binding protein
MLTTNNLSYQYKGSEAIQFPDLQVKKNEALLICGESGCGKTTLLHILAGLRRPKEGEIMINGHWKDLIICNANIETNSISFKNKLQT